MFTCPIAKIVFEWKWQTASWGPENMKNNCLAEPRWSQRDVVYCILAFLNRNAVGGGGVSGNAGSQPMSTAVHMDPK
jgi:hypothetical protein